MYNKKSKIELKKSLKRESFNRITCSFYKYCFIDNPEDLRNKLFLDLIEHFNKFCDSVNTKHGLLNICDNFAAIIPIIPS